jgi:5-methylcytosine-specific restriction protein B
MEQLIGLEPAPYLRLIEEHDKYYQDRIHLLTDAHELFMSDRRLSELSDEDRAILLGQKKQMASGAPYDANLFGSPGGSGYVGGIISSGYPHLDDFFAAIPRTGLIDDQQYQRLVSLFVEGVGNAGCKIKPFVFFTRIMSVVRPDTFVSDADNVLAKHAKGLNVANPNKDFDKYWSEFLSSVHQIKPFAELVGNPKNVHLAMLDGMSWSEVDDQKSNEKLNNMDVKKTALNQILYGPPGTGKTYNTINRALQVVAPEFYHLHKDNRVELKSHFDELVAKNRIGFVTFHQSFSYEDFVEGLRANSDEAGQVSYDLEDGIFKRMCAAANAKPIMARSQHRVDVSGRKVWKMSLGDTLGNEAYIYDQCLENNYVLLGYGYNVDFSASKDRNGVIEAYKFNGIEIEKKSNDYRVTSVQNFKNVMSIGDLIVVSDGNRKFRAIAEVIGDYQYDPTVNEDESYSQMRKVIWHRVYEPSLPADELFNKNLSQMTLYRLREPVLDVVKLQEILAGETTQNGTVPSVTSGSQISSYVVESISDEIISLRKPNGSLLHMPRIIIDELVSLVKLNRISVDDIRSKRVFERIVDSDMEKYIINGYPNVLAPLVETIHHYGLDTKATTPSDKRVLIIDEINRGNISNIFGELITLIEPSKRAGGIESLTVKLPYSKEPFSVPSNLHIIGTMNTADKSLAQVDIALRRRFEFVEMMPKHELLADINVEGINIARLLETINQRIELLYDREHTIGHSFFLPLKDDPTIKRLARIFELEILPLLEEYFFEDWERVGQVLGDHFKKANLELKFIEEKFTDASVLRLMGSDWAQDSIRPYKRNMAAFTNPEAYIGIYDSPQK